MKTLIKALFQNKKKVVKRNNRSLGSFESNQFAKMGRLGQTLVVLSR